MKSNMTQHTVTTATLKSITGLTEDEYVKLSELLAKMRASQQDEEENATARMLAAVRTQFQQRLNNADEAEKEKLTQDIAAIEAKMNEASLPHL